MKSVALKAYPRSQVQRAEVTKLRRVGRVPATIYGRLAKPQNLEVNSKEFADLMHHSASENLLVDLSVENDARSKRLALVQEIQHHPLDGKVLHVDFHEVAENEKVTVHVPVETTGEAAGVKTGGGVLEHVLFKLKVRCLPKNLPEQIVIDVTALEIGKAIHLGDIKAPEGVEILGDKHITVVAVAAPRAEEEVVAPEAAKAAGDVEMTKEKKEEGEEGAAPAKAGEKEKAPAKGDAKAAAAGDKKAEAKPEAKAEGRRNNFSGASRFPRAWSNCISSWAWEIRARNTRRRATTPVFCWSKNWRRSGNAIGRTKRNFDARIAKAECNGRNSSAVRAADVHEFERRDGRSAERFLSVAAEADFGRGGRRGFAVWRNPVARKRQQRRASRFGIHRAAFGVARVCEIADWDRAQRRFARNYKLRSRKI